MGSAENFVCANCAFIISIANVFVNARSQVGCRGFGQLWLGLPGARLGGFCHLAVVASVKCCITVHQFLAAAHLLDTTGWPGTNSGAAALRPAAIEEIVLGGSSPVSVAEVRWPPNARRPVGRDPLGADPETPIWRLEGLFRFPRDR